MNNELLMYRAKAIAGALREKDGWTSCDELATMCDLSVGQVKAAVKFQRRLFLDHPDKLNSVYILSGPKGYKLSKTDDDYVAMYKSLYAWGKSVLVTISPIGKYLEKKGFDVKKMRKEAMEGHGLITDSIGGNEAWQD